VKLTNLSPNHSREPNLRSAARTTCIGCRQRKPLTGYFRSRRSPDGLYQRCKRCCAESRRRSYLKSRPRILAYQRDYYAAHKAETAVLKKAYRKKHRARLSEYFRVYRRRHRTKLLEYGRKYRQTRKPLDSKLALGQKPRS
jgi:hypothetical protein